MQTQTTEQTPAQTPDTVAAPLNNDMRLAMDLRLATEQPDARYLIDAFMSQYRQLGEFVSAPATPVVVTHNGQEWEGLARHANTDKRLVRWAWMPKWESQFAEQSRLEVWHQFAPVDKIRAARTSTNIITVLPACEHLPARGRLPEKTVLVAPSETDRARLVSLFRMPSERVVRMVPAIRPFLFQAPLRQPPNDGWLLFIVGKKRDVPRVEKWMQIISGRYPKVAHKLVMLESDTVSLKPENWVKLLEQTKICFYFSQSAFDWAVPAFEAMYSRVPTVFLEDCHSISELLPKFPLSLPRFLVDSPEGEALNDCADEAFSLLREAGVFDSTRLAEQLTALYDSRSHSLSV